MECLPLEKRKALLEAVSEKQRDFIENELKRGYKTIFTRLMQSEKINIIRMTDVTLEENEQQAQDWEIIHYFDYGLGNRFGRCACGKSLRFEFVVEHVVTKKQIHYGKYHLADFLNIDVADVNIIIDGLHSIDYEADELLTKIQQNNYGYDILDCLAKDVTLPKDIQAHIDNHIPLLERQISRLERMVDEYHKEQAMMEQTITEHTEPTTVSFSNAFASKISDNFKEIPVVEEVEEQPKKIEMIGNDRIAEIAYQLVLDGVSSATKISHIIRDNYEVNKEYSLSTSGRPRIYPTVLSRLHVYAEKGLIYHDKESSGVKDSYFFPKPL